MSKHKVNDFGYPYMEYDENDTHTPLRSEFDSGLENPITDSVHMENDCLLGDIQPAGMNYLDHETGKTKTSFCLALQNIKGETVVIPFENMKEIKMFTQGIKDAFEVFKTQVIKFIPYPVK